LPLFAESFKPHPNVSNHNSIFQETGPALLLCIADFICRFSKSEQLKWT